MKKFGLSMYLVLGQDLCDLPDAATQLLAAEVVTETDLTFTPLRHEWHATQCQVTGYRTRQVQFEIRLAKAICEKSQAETNADV